MQIQAFDFNSKNIRVVEHDGQVWFILKDLCDALGIKASWNVFTRLDADQTATLCLTESIPKGNPNRQVVNESGMWDVLMRSDSKKARPFQRWLTSEVLPALRRTGTYTQPEAAAPLPAPAAASTDLMSMFQQLASTVLQPLAAQTAQAVQAVEAKVEAAKAEVREEMTSIAHQMDTKIGSLPITSTQARNVKDMVNAVVQARKGLGMANWHWGKVYDQTWRACGVGSLDRMTRVQYPQVVEYLGAELDALRAMHSGNGSLFH